MPESLSDKFAEFRAAPLLKKRLWHRYFPVYFAKFLRTPFYRTPPVTTLIVLLRNTFVIHLKIHKSHFFL